MNKPIEYYMDLPYKVDIYPEEDGTGYTATIPDLPGCITSAETIDNLWESLAEAKMLWLELAIEDGDHIPEPAPVEEEEFSGRFVARLPRSLHRELAGRAKREDTSLNQLVVMLLSEGMGRWHESRDQYRVFSDLFAKYQEVSYKQFSGVYALVMDSLGAAPKEIEHYDFSWPTEGWKVHRKHRVRTLG
ncbi:MAG: type II toxin-antitoxin system HicB family antitoxin [Anaerolineales bacterium]